MTASKSYHKSGFKTYENGHFAFNTIIPQMYYRKNDLIRSDEKGKKANLFHLGELLNVDSISTYISGKYVIIGNFMTDQHSTYLGSLPGPLILFNTYLTLQYHSIRVYSLWLVFLYFVFAGISHFLFMHPEKKFKRWHNKFKAPFLTSLFNKYISYIGILVLVNIVSFFFFGTFVSLFYLATYLTFLQLVIEKVAKFRKSPDLATFLKEEFT